jgi:hypothetical protein
MWIISKAILLALLMWSAIALADGIYNGGRVGDPTLWGGINQFNSTGGSGPVACSNKLDFTQACNSQYFGAIL